MDSFKFDLDILIKTCPFIHKIDKSLYNLYKRIDLATVFYPIIFFKQLQYLILEEFAKMSRKELNLDFADYTVLNS